ncbi:MAG TPA: PP0621 family protein [Albitalea sp.]|nr:PP0621 family protein [Albitalea sp.]
MLLVVVVVVLWLARGRRPLSPGERANGGSAAPKQETMVACAHCGLHLPRNEALPGRGGLFCGEAHRAAFEKAHPSA